MGWRARFGTGAAHFSGANSGQTALFERHRLAIYLQLCSAGGIEHKESRPKERGTDMLNWALTFFLIALLAAVFGFGGVAVAAAGVARICFFIFLVLFVVSLVAHGVRRV